LAGFIYLKLNNVKYTGIFSSIYVYNEIFLQKDYDKIIPNDGWNIFDIGSNIGLYTMYLNDNFSNLNIHTFDPINQLYEQQSHNINSNKKNNNKININNFGLGEKETTEIINFYPYADGLSSINNDMNEKREHIINMKSGENILFKLFYSMLLNDNILKSQKEKIKIIIMSEYIRKYDIKKNNLVKIDVEGFELNVIEGIDEEHFKIIDNFIIEVENYNPENLQKIKYILRKNNFEIIDYYPNQKWTIISAKKIIMLIYLINYNVLIYSKCLIYLMYF
jgi:FkbM family methyltransferase